jgi:hypothetical protein
MSPTRVRGSKAKGRFGKEEEEEEEEDPLLSSYHDD